jgi:hypothetical protein
LCKKNPKRANLQKSWPRTHQRAQCMPLPCPEAVSKVRCQPAPRGLYTCSLREKNANHFILASKNSDLNTYFRKTKRKYHPTFTKAFSHTNNDPSPHKHSQAREPPIHLVVCVLAPKISLHAQSSLPLDFACEGARRRVQSAVECRRQTSTLVNVV